MDNMENIKQQFEQYLDNQINNPMFLDGEAEREIPFAKYDEIKEEDIFLKVTSGNETYSFNYNCYFEYENGNGLYDFEIYA